MIIDAKNMILGRLASYAAKQTLRGEQVHIINAEQAVITGSKQNVLAHYIQKRDRGHPYSGPFFQRREDRLLKKTILGMIPHKQAKGREAGKRLRCYINIPPQFQGKEAISLQNIDITKTKNVKYISLKELCGLLGKKQ